jgi:hypothetical protein
MQMFLMPAEVEGLVRPLAQQDRLWLVAAGVAGRERVWIPGAATGEMPRLLDGFRGHILVCIDRPPSTQPDDELDGDAVRLEWPTFANGVLQLAQHDTRTDRDDILRVADRLFRRMRKASHRPVWAWDPDDPTTARPYRDISITPGAEVWCRSGRPLGQLGSDAVRFGAEPPLT